MTALLVAQAAGGARLQSDEAIRRMLADRVEAQGGKGAGIVVGIIEPGRRRVISDGQISEQDRRAPQSDTVFEIGSVTKVFTALLLADMVQRREVALEDPVTKYLPITLPERDGRPITFADLATHTAGLPLVPDDLPAQLNDDLAKAKYSLARFYEFLARYELPRQSGTKWDYSNVGYSLLGHALSARAGTDYAQLLQTRIVTPLALKGTGVTPKPQTTIAVGHGSLQPTPPISTVPAMTVMMPAGSVLSTADDLLTLLSVALGYERSPLTPAMEAMLKTRRPGWNGEQALGWMITGKGDDQMIMHDGGTFGFASSIVWDPKKRVGVVVLSNHTAPVGDLARRLLREFQPSAIGQVRRANEQSLLFSAR